MQYSLQKKAKKSLVCNFCQVYNTGKSRCAASASFPIRFFFCVSLMGIGKQYQLSFETVICPKTRVAYERLTPLDVLSHHPYFYNNIFTRDDQKMIFTSMLDGKRKNFYLLDMQTQVATQLTDDDVSEFGGAIAAQDEYVYVTLNNQLTRIHLKTLEREVIYTPPQGYTTYDTPGISADGKWIITMDWLQKEEETPGLSGWESFLEKSKRGITSKLTLVDVEHKTARVLLDSTNYPYPNVKNKQWLGHPQFCTADEQLISYCHEGLGGTVDARIWFIDRNTNKITCPRPHDFPTQIISHEFWFKRSKTMGYVKIEDERSPFSAIELLDAETSTHRELIQLPRSSHFISSHDDRFIIADGDFYPDKLYLYLVDVQEKTYRPLVYHGSISYGRAAEVHAHPLFDNSDQHIIFTSDWQGQSAIYRLKL